MTNTQVTLVQIDNYGPWTVTPEPRREADLQTMQARLYADVSQFIGNRGGYVFSTRFDNMIAVTNGLGIDAHALLQESIANRYPVTVSLGVATGATPAAALRDATAHLQEAGSAQDSDRREILAGRSIPEESQSAEDVRIAHFDVNDATDEYTDELDAYETFIEIERGYAALMRRVYRAHDGLSFFVGGDNVIAVCPDLEPGTYGDVLERVERETDVALKVGVGAGGRAQDAGMAAKHALERCRARGTRVEFAE